MEITITYASRKDERYDKAYKPCVWVNGKFHYHTERAKKSFNGGLKVAERIANELAKSYRYNNLNTVNVNEIK